MKHLTKTALAWAVAVLIALALFKPVRAQGPVTVTANDNLGSARYMDVTATWDAKTNTVVGETRVYVHHFGTGFTGGTSATLNDASGHVLATMPQLAFGVDGQGFFWSRSSRQEHWSFAVAPQVANQVASITIMNSLAPHNRLGDILGQVGGIFKAVVSAVSDTVNAISSIVGSSNAPSGDKGSSGSAGSSGTIKTMTAKLPRTADLIAQVSALETTKATTVALPPGTSKPSSLHSTSAALPWLPWLHSTSQAPPWLGQTHRFIPAPMPIYPSGRYSNHYSTNRYYAPTAHSVQTAAPFRAYGQYAVPAPPYRLRVFGR